VTIDVENIPFSVSHGLMKKLYTLKV